MVHSLNCCLSCENCLSREDSTIPKKARLLRANFIGLEIELNLNDSQLRSLNFARTLRSFIEHSKIEGD
jgi:hypothetical protein